MIKSWSDEAWEDFEYWTKQDKKLLNAYYCLLKTLIVMDMTVQENLKDLQEIYPITGVGVLMTVIVLYIELTTKQLKLCNAVPIIEINNIHYLHKCPTVGHLQKIIDILFCNVYNNIVGRNPRENTLTDRRS